MQHDRGLQSCRSWNCGLAARFGRDDDRRWLAGDVKDRRSSGIAIWVKGSVENTGYPVCMRPPRSRTWFV